MYIFRSCNLNLGLRSTRVDGDFPVNFLKAFTYERLCLYHYRLDEKRCWSQVIYSYRLPVASH